MFRLSKKSGAGMGCQALFACTLFYCFQSTSFLFNQQSIFINLFKKSRAEDTVYFEYCTIDCICNVVEFPFSRLTTGGRGLSQTNDPGILIYNVHHFSPNEWSFPPAKSARGNVCVRQRGSAANCPFSFYP